MYEKPAWLSRGSVELLDSMLQTDPKRRITVEHLLCHPWLMDGYDRPVKWQSTYHSEAEGQLDRAVVEEIAAHRLCSPRAVAEMVGQWDYTASLTSTYFILLDRRHKGQAMGLAGIGARAVGSPMREISLNSPAAATNTAGSSDTPKRAAAVLAAAAPTLGDSPRGLHNSLEGGLDDLDLLSIGKQRGRQQQQQQQSVPAGKEGTPSKQDGANFDRSRNRASERYHIPNKKRQQSTETDKENRTPSRKNGGCSSHPMAANSPLSPSRSVDSGLNTSGAKGGATVPAGVRTPKSRGKSNNDWVFATPERPVGGGFGSGGGGANGMGSGKAPGKNVLGSIERGLDKMKNMLTPRRSRHSSSDSRPALVTGKALCNISTTSNHNPDAVLSDLTRALVSKGISCQQKGYILRGKIRDSSGFAKLSFELEVCRIPNLNVVGIRRKRLKGDAWCYKKVCEEVLRLAAVSKAQGGGGNMR